MTTPSKSNDILSEQHHTPDKQTSGSTQRTHAERPNPLTLQEDEPVASSAPSSVLQSSFTSGITFSSPTFLASSVQSNMDGSDSTSMSTLSRTRFDLDSAGKSRLVNEQDELEGGIDVNTADNQVATWGTDVHDNDCKRQFINFLKNFHLNVEETNAEGVDPPKSFYMKKLDEIHLHQHPFLNVDCTHMNQFDKAMLNQLHTNPEEAIPIFDKAVNELFLSIYKDDTLPHQIQVRPYNVDMFPNMHCLNPEDTNKLITRTGIVIGSSLRIIDMRLAYFSCKTCRCAVQVENDRGRTTEPTSCKLCNSTRSFELIPNRSLFANKQFIKLQVTPEEMPAGQVPMAVAVVAYNDLVDAVQLGDHVQVTGIFREVPDRIDPKTRKVPCFPRTFINAIHFHRQKTFTAEDGIEDQTTNDDEESFSSKFSKERLAQFRHLSERLDIYQLLANAIAPSIFGHEDIKKGILLQLFGGTKKSFMNAEQKRLRSQINILLCGNPGTAKSQLQQYIFHLIPHAQYINGKDTSAAGLSAAVIKDSETDQFLLQIGALVLADNGICCIDGFDKMSESARSILHEVMKQQTLSIAEAGFNCTLNARTSILAAANSIEPQWNKSKTIIENIQLRPTLLSHFDLIFLLPDPQEKAYDSRLTKPSVSLDQYGKGSENADEALDRDLLRDYISYARTFVSPQLTESARKLLFASYIDIDKVDSKEQVPPREEQFQIMTRLALAHAKLRLSFNVKIVDVKEAIRLFGTRLIEVGVDNKALKANVNADVIETLEHILDDLKPKYGTRPIMKEVLFNEMRHEYDDRITRDMFNDAIRALEEEMVVVATNVAIRLITTDLENVDISDSFTDIREQAEQSTDLKELHGLLTRTDSLMNFTQNKLKRIPETENNPNIRFLKQRLNKIQECVDVIVDLIKKMNEYCDCPSADNGQEEECCVDDNNKKFISSNSSSTTTQVSRTETTSVIPNPWAR